MSDTLETDAQDIKFIKVTKFSGLEEEMVAYVPKVAMERIERERDEALEQAHLSNVDFFQAAMDRSRAEEERDQWRECAEKLADILSVGGTIRALEQDGRIALAEFYRLKGEAK